MQLLRQPTEIGETRREPTEGDDELGRTMTLDDLLDREPGVRGHRLEVGTVIGHRQLDLPVLQVLGQVVGPVLDSREHRPAIGQAVEQQRLRGRHDVGAVELTGRLATPGLGVRRAHLVGAAALEQQRGFTDG